MRHLSKEFLEQVSTKHTQKTIHSDMDPIASFSCASCSKSFETSRGLKLHVSRYCSKPNDKIKNSNCAGPSSQIETRPLTVHSCEQNLDTDRYVSSHIKSAFFHTKHTDFKIKNKQKSKKEKLKLPSSKTGNDQKRLKTMLK